MKSTLMIGVLATAFAIPEGEAAQLSFSDSVAAIVRAERDGEWDEALGETNALLAAADRLELSEYQRAELHFASGVIRARRDDLAEPQDLLPALPAFASARALAGPTPLRLDASYDLGTTELLRGERHRLRIPERGGQMPQMALPAVPPPAGGDEEEPPDPLDEARAAYLSAKAHLIERLRADWSDEDVRANLELIQRRLRELDEIEKQREQQEQEQDQEGEGDPKDKEDGQEGDGEKQEGDEREGDEQEGEDPSEQKPEDGTPGEGEQDPEPPPTSGEENASEPGEAQPASPGDERHLTKEEVMRLLESLEQIEQQGEEVRRALQQARRVPVEKDW